jgi:hypothetical protein
VNETTEQVDWEAGLLDLAEDVADDIIRQRQQAA